MMRRLSATSIALAALTAPLAAQQRNSDQALLDQAARLTPASEPVGNSADDERQARAGVALAEARLELVLARRELKAGRSTQAAQHALAARTRLAEAPADVDTDELSLQIDGILARTGTPRGGAAAPAGARLPDYLDHQVKAAQEIAQGFGGADTRDVNTRPDAESLRQRTLATQVPTDDGYRPAREIFDGDAIARRGEQRLPYQDALRDAYLDDEQRRLIEIDEDRIAPQDWVSYPDDWMARMERRKKYEGGQIARGPSHTGPDGQEWYLGLYDLHDLIYVAPDFQPTVGFTFDAARDAADRQYLRERSWIFNGTPADLAAGIPLLRYFGGVDDFAYRGPKYSMERYGQILQMMQAFSDRHSEAKMIPLPPIQ